MVGIPTRMNGILTALDFGIFSNVKGLSYYANEDEDPYITLKGVCSPPRD